MCYDAVAHEFGHVEDAYQRPSLFQQLNEYNDIAKKLNKELGATFGSDPRYKAIEEKVLKTGGYKSLDEMSTDKDRRAEKTMIPVIQQHFGNAGKRKPKSVQKAIDKFNAN